MTKYTSFNPEIHLKTYQWVKKICDKLTPQHGGSLVIKGIEEYDTNAYSLDYYIQIIEVIAPPQTFFGQLFGSSKEILVFSVMTPNSDTVLYSGQVPHDGNHTDYPQLRKLVEKYSPYLKSKKKS